MSVAVSSLRDFVLHLRPAALDASPFDQPDRSSRTNQLFGIGEESTLHFDAMAAELVRGQPRRLLRLRGLDPEDLELDWEEDLEKVDSLETDMATRVAMMNPLYWLSGHYEGYGQAAVAPYWARQRGPVRHRHLPLATASNIVLALRKYDGVTDIAAHAGLGPGPRSRGALRFRDGKPHLLGHGLLHGIRGAPDGMSNGRTGRLAACAPGRLARARQTLFVGVTLFSMFFGAGNLILPPLLGAQAGGEPAGHRRLLRDRGGPSRPGIVAVALAGTLRELAARVHPGLCARLRRLGIPCDRAVPGDPRTASTAFEMLSPLLRDGLPVERRAPRVLRCVLRARRSSPCTPGAPHAPARPRHRPRLILPDRARCGSRRRPRCCDRAGARRPRRGVAPYDGNAAVQGVPHGLPDHGPSRLADLWPRHRGERAGLGRARRPGRHARGVPREARLRACS